VAVLLQWISDINLKEKIDYLFCVSKLCGLTGVVRISALYLPNHILKTWLSE
jgi:hypothetical protein